MAGRRYVAELDELLACRTRSSTHAVGRDGRAGHRLVPRCDKPGWFPLNIPNTGQVADLPDDVVVEAMCVVDGAGVRGRDVARCPAAARRARCAGCRRRRSSRSRRRSPATATGSSTRCSSTRSPGASTTTRLRRMTDEMLTATPTLAARSSREPAGARHRGADGPGPPDRADALGRGRGRGRGRGAPGGDRERRGAANVMLATGNSQLAFLAALDRTSTGRSTGRRSPAFHMDEYIGIAPTHPACFAATSASGRRARVPIRRVPLLDGDAPDPDAECAPLRGAARRRIRSTCAASASARTGTSRSTTRRSPTSTTRST